MRPPGRRQAQATALADELGLMPEDIQIMIKLTREEEARAALDQFGSMISTFPTERAGGDQHGDRRG